MSKPWKQNKKKEDSLPKGKFSVSDYFMAAEFGACVQIDLHGFTVDSAVHAIDQYLNKQFIAGERAVKIIHGRGTGILRNAVHKHLATIPFVEAFRDSLNPSETLGVTVVVLHDVHVCL